MAIGTIIDGGKVHTLFVDLPPVNFLLNCAHRDESIDNHISLLSDSKDPIDCLIVVRRVPVRVEDYGSVGPCQIEAKTTDLRGKQGAEN